MAFWALGEMVKAEAGILETDPAEAAAAKLDGVVTGLLEDGAEAAWVAGHLRPLVGLAGAGESGGDRQAEAFAAWRRFLEALAEQGPAVLVFEDLHWADDASSTSSTTWSTGPPTFPCWWSVAPVRSYWLAGRAGVVASQTRPRYRWRRSAPTTPPG